jgi:hypothetical protein
MGLTKPLLEAILNRDTEPTTMDEWVTAAQTELRKHHNRQSMLNPGKHTYKWVHAAQNAKPQRYIHPNDRTVPMDVDDGAVFQQIRRVQTEEEKRQYFKEGRCYFCGQQGHMARSCPKKKEQPFKPTFQSNQQRFPSNKPPFKKKFGNQPKRTQGFRKTNKPRAFNFVQQARGAAIEEMEEEQEYEEEEDDITDLAARTTRLSDGQKEQLLAQMANSDF